MKSTFKIIIASFGDNTFDLLAEGRSEIVYKLVLEYTNLIYELRHIDT